VIPQVLSINIFCVTTIPVDARTIPAFLSTCSSIDTNKKQVDKQAGIVQASTGMVVTQKILMLNT
jgi:hypothetical protein